MRYVLLITAFFMMAISVNWTAEKFTTVKGDVLEISLIRSLCARERARGRIHAKCSLYEAPLSIRGTRIIPVKRVVVK